jgi:hypothetical protein
MTAGRSTRQSEPTDAHTCMCLPALAVSDFVQLDVPVGRVHCHGARLLLTARPEPRRALIYAGPPHSTWQAGRPFTPDRYARFISGTTVPKSILLVFHSLITALFNGDKRTDGQNNSTSRAWTYIKLYTKSYIFCKTMPCSPLEVNRRFGGIYSLHLHRRISRPPVG